MAVEVVVPEEYMGDVIGDLNSRRGRINGMNPRGNMQVVDGRGAARARCSVTRPTCAARRRAAPRTRCSSRSYEPVPDNIEEEIVAKVKGS